MVSAEKSSSNDISTGELTTLASRINEAHDAATTAAKSAIEHARNCGQLLIEAKSRLHHGQWLTWLKRNCKVGERQARNYMRVAEHWDRIKSEPGAEMTVKGALRLLNEANEPEYVLPPLTTTTRLLCLGPDSLAVVEPIGGRYYYVGVYRNLNHSYADVIETKRGIIDYAVPQVLKAAEFKPVGEWEVEPFDPRPGKDDHLVWSLAARQYWTARITQTEASA